MEHKYSPLKRRFSEWISARLIAVALLLLLTGLPILLWLMTYNSDAAIIMFVTTWLSLTVFVLIMVKRGELDPRFFVDGKVIDRTKREIEAHRQSVRRELVANEMKALRQGKKTPVLDLWRLDESLAKRHPFFSSTTSLLLDPTQRELQIRIQIGEICKIDNDKRSFSTILFNDVIAYLRVISQDPYLFMERSFFDRLILIADSLREDERHIDVPYPILSLLVDSVGFWSIKVIPAFDKKHLQMIAEIRFDDGNEIQPHRVIDLPSARGLK